MIAVLDKKAKEIEVYRDKTQAVHLINKSVRTLNRHFKENNYYEDENYLLTPTYIVTSNRGNPNL